MDAVRDAAGAHWRKIAGAAFVSVVTMPITAVFFMLLGSVLVMGSAAVAMSQRAEAPGATAFVGLGLMVGPTVYFALALLS